MLAADEFFDTLRPPLCSEWQRGGRSVSFQAKIHRDCRQPEADCGIVARHGAGGGKSCDKTKKISTSVAAGRMPQGLCAQMPGKQGEYRTVFAGIPPAFCCFRLKQGLFQWFWTASRVHSMLFMTQMESHSTNREINDFFLPLGTPVTQPAFVQARDKFNDRTFPTLLQRFNAKYPFRKTKKRSAHLRNRRI